VPGFRESVDLTFNRAAKMMDPGPVKGGIGYALMVSRDEVDALGMITCECALA
jgi:hypothetical protein